jgi:tRNA wybutosine-synthesizing protein 3
MDNQANSSQLLGANHNSPWPTPSMSSAEYNLHAPPLPQSFVRKKAKILSLLAVPAKEYDDLSPKGSIDEGIRDLIDEINACDGFVTTSSCAGRISVFLEGQKKKNENQSWQETGSGNGVGDYGDDGTRDENVIEGAMGDGHMTIQERSVSAKLAGVGGKGGGGRWLFVSHDPVRIEAIKGGTTSFLGMKRPDSLSIDAGIFAEERLIHFKFEPMVSRHSSSFSVPEI